MNKKHLILTLKILVIVAAFALVFSKIDTDKLGDYLLQTSPFTIIGCYLALTVAQIASGLRTRYYFAHEGLVFNKKFAIGLYFVGMFFNNLLPGGIGGDGYKVYLLGKLAGFPHLTAVRLLISERANGLLAMLLFMYGLMFFSSVPTLLPYSDLIILAVIIVTIVGYFISIRLLLKEKTATAVGALPYSIAVQFLGIVIVVLLLTDTAHLSDITGIVDYLILFSIASVVAIIPVSIGGIGIREVVFVYGAGWFSLDPELGVAVALLFFVISLLVSLNGLLFWHKLERLYQGDNDGSITNT